MCTIYESCICPTLEYGSIVYSRAANTHLHRFDDLQSQIEWSCLFVFQPLSHHQKAAIMKQVCHLLPGEGRGNLQIYCSQLCCNQTLVDLIVPTPGTQLNIYVLLTTAIS